MVHNQSSQKTGDLNQGPNLVSLTETGDELSRRQARDWCTGGQTDTHKQTEAGNDNTWRPKLASGKHSGIIEILPPT